MAIKKSELYSKLWKSCDELRGGMDASQYKDYILTLLFVKYVSDRYAGDEDALFEVPEGASFSDLVKLKGGKEIGDFINKQILAPLAKENGLGGVIDLANFNDEDKLGKGQEMQDRLSNLIAIFEDLDFSKNRADGDDLLGDAYEYLMQHFATQSGKSKGQFYTPAEVSRIMAKIISIQDSKSQEQSIYDPTCGSGSLLLKAAAEAPHGISIYGQEMDNSTVALAKMNMVIHNHLTAKDGILQGNTLASPLHFAKEKGTDGKSKLKTFDFAIANPPFSSKAWSNGFIPEQDDFGRFEHGMPPEKNGDFAFLLHILTSLKSKGKGAIILPHGVLFRGNAEAGIRRKLIRKGFIKGIIGLPPNLFYGTGIPACIIVVDKENAEHRDGIFIIDAGKDFLKDGNKNRLREQDIRKITDTFNAQLPLLGYSRMVSNEEIAENDYNLNIPRYIDGQEAEDIQDIEAHLRGGIPLRDVDALDEYWQVCPGLRAALFTDSGRENYRQLTVAGEEVKPTVYAHPEFVTYAQSIEARFTEWEKKYLPYFKGLELECKPKEIIKVAGDDVLTGFAEKKLIDKYDIYQHLMNYWAETMQDDVYTISSDGWKATPMRIVVENKAGKEVDKGWSCDLVPKILVSERYFKSNLQYIAALEAEKETNTQEREETEQERSGEEDILADLAESGKKIKLEAVMDRLKEYMEEAKKEFFPHDYRLLNMTKGLWQKSLAELEVYSFDSSKGAGYLQKYKSGRGGLIAKAKVKKRVVQICEIITNEAFFSKEEKEAVAALPKSFVSSDWKMGNEKPEFKELDNCLAYLTAEDKERADYKQYRTEYEELNKNLISYCAEHAEEETVKNLTDLERYIFVMQEEKRLTKEIKVAEDNLDNALYEFYPSLTETQVKQLVVEDKWLTTLRAAVEGETDRISRNLTRRVRELSDRYARTLPDLNAQTVALEEKVFAHFEKMGLVWN